MNVMGSFSHLIHSQKTDSKDEAMLISVSYREKERGSGLTAISQYKEDTQTLNWKVNSWPGSRGPCFFLLLLQYPVTQN